MVASNRLSKDPGLRLLGDVPSEKAFYCCNGEVYRNVRDLEAGLEHMRDDYFAYHANPEKNDFSKWVKDVIDDGYLAAKLAACRTREEALEVVTKRLARLEKPRARRTAGRRTYAPAKAETSART